MGDYRRENLKPDTFDCFFEKGIKSLISGLILAAGIVRLRFWLASRQRQD